MAFAEDMKQTVQEIFWAYAPVPKEKRGVFLAKVEERVRYYKPKIEEKTGVKLGDVKVRDNKHFLSEVPYRSTYLDAAKNAWKQGRLPTKRDVHASFLASSIGELILFVPFGIYNFINDADFRYYDSTIYVPFNFSNRFMDIDFKKRIKRLDYGVVHELSHTLWEKILGEPGGQSGEGRKWFEGFATYCADEYFAEFYPSGTQKMTDLPKVYLEGKKKVEELIEAQGEQTLLKIPLKWMEFSQRNS